MFAKRNRKTLISAALTAMIIFLATGFLGCDSTNTDNFYNSINLQGEDLSGSAFFMYSSDDLYYFTKQTSSSGFGETLAEGHWHGDYWPIVRVNVGGEQFIMGQDSDKRGFIQKLYPTGDLGQETYHSTWHQYYETLAGYEAGGNAFIFGQGGRYHKNWFIQEVNPGGGLGHETSKGSWSRYYDSVVPIYKDGRSYLFGHSDEDNHWFIQKVHSYGDFGYENSSGSWNHFYQTIAPIQWGDRAFIFGHKNTTWGWEKKHWFIQEVHSGGKLASHASASGNWDNYYDTVSFVTIDDTVYCFGQSAESRHWFLQEVKEDMSMGRVIQSGTWKDYYSSALPFAVDEDYAHTSDWMTRMKSLLQDRYLRDIALPGSHDAGMSEIGTCFLAAECNTQTQLYPIAKQLEYGARYFDIRPVLDINGGQFYLGHFTWYTAGEDKDDSYPGLIGCQGERLEDVLHDVNSFLDSHPGELVILKFSHCKNLKDNVNSCSDDIKDQYLALVKDILDDNLVKCDDCDLNAPTTFAEILELGNVIALVDNVSSDKKHGIFSFGDDLSVYDHYSNTESLDEMMNDQLSKLFDHDNHHDELFLLSWTLTLDEKDAIKCEFGHHPNILDLATEADDVLYREIYELINSKLITENLFPNIIYVDAFRPFATHAAILLNKAFGNPPE